MKVHNRNMNAGGMVGEREREIRLDEIWNSECVDWFVN